MGVRGSDRRGRHVNSRAEEGGRKNQESLGMFMYQAVAAAPFSPEDEL